MVILPKCRCCQCDCPPLLAAEDFPSWWAECRDRPIYATVTIEHQGCPSRTLEMTMINSVDAESQNWFASTSDTLGATWTGDAENLLEIEIGCCQQSNYNAPGGQDCTDKKSWFIDLALTAYGRTYAYVGCDDCPGDIVETRLIGYADLESSHCSCPELSETSYTFTMVTATSFCLGNTANTRTATATVLLSYAP